MSDHAFTARAMSEIFAPAGHHAEEEAVANAAFGFWIYLMSDCVLFAALFAGFAIYSHSYAGGPNGKALFDLSDTLIETLLLLSSSLTCGMATLAMQGGKRQAVVAWLAITFVLGFGFVGMECHEFIGMVLAGHGPDGSAFLSAFFALVATHGTHVTLGLVWMLVMMAQVLAKGLTDHVESRLMRLGMFWHFLDIVWVGVFTIVYLRGVL